MILPEQHCIFCGRTPWQVYKKDTGLGHAVVHGKLVCEDCLKKDSQNANDPS